MNLRNRGNVSLWSKGQACFLFSIIKFHLCLWCKSQASWLQIIQDSGSQYSEFFCSKPTAFVGIICPLQETLWELGLRDAKYANFMATAITVSNILPFASDSGISTLLPVSLKLWQCNLSACKEGKILDLQSSWQLYNAFLCLPNPPIVFLSLPWAGWLPCICIASGHVLINQILLRFYLRIISHNTLNIDAQSGH